ncbi:MAG: efflux RND transporter periplasmic adaptor subunit [Acidobacteria bacterium]|nr:MAG: efflux RND transporter periplasmic adaptor subunit [Acidobacteriota bacterium]
MTLSKYCPLLLIPLLLILLSGCAASQQAAGPADPPPASVTVTPVKQVAVSASTEYVGRTESVSSVDLRARVTGFLTKRTFEEGADVREGELLYVIEQEPYRNAVEIAEASAAHTEATLENADKFLARLNSVKDTGGTSQANVEAAESKVLETRALLKERRARLVDAKLDLGYTEIRAPINGRIGRAAVHVGNLVGPESGVLATIVQLDPMWVSFPISERDYLKLQETVSAGRRGGQGIAQLVPTIRLVDGSTFRYKGRIDFQDNRVDRATGTIELRATFPNPQLLLRPGQFVTVVQTERASTYRLVIPQAAVQSDQVGPFVFTVDREQKAQVRRIKVGNEFGTDLIVTDGLSEGESVISGGIQKVTPGNRVNPVAALPESEGGPAGAQ